MHTGADTWHYLAEYIHNAEKFLTIRDELFQKMEPKKTGKCSENNLAAAVPAVEEGMSIK